MKIKQKINFKKEDYSQNKKEKLNQKFAIPIEGLLDKFKKLLLQQKIIKILK